MKNRKLMIIFTALLVLSCKAQEVGYIISDMVILRDGPNFDSNILGRSGQFYHGEKISVIEVSTNQSCINGKKAFWKHISIQDQYYWLWGGYLSDSKPFANSSELGNKRVAKRKSAFENRMQQKIESVHVFSEDDMVFVKGGEFYIGDDVIIPVQEIIVDDFYISKYLITVQDWFNYCDAKKRDNTKGFHGNEVFYNFLHEGDLRRFDAQDVDPAWVLCGVDFNKAISFCNWLNLTYDKDYMYSLDLRTDSISDKSSVYYDRASKYIWMKSKDGYRLPTFAEWVYAAKGGVYAAEETISYDDLMGMGWFLDNSEYPLYEPGTKKPNALGLFDMFGLVQQWCWDLYNQDYILNMEKVNPSGPDAGYVQNFYYPPYDADADIENLELSSYSARIAAGYHIEMNPNDFSYSFCTPVNPSLEPLPSPVGFRVARSAKNDTPKGTE